MAPPCSIISTMTDDKISLSSNHPYLPWCRHALFQALFDVSHTQSASQGEAEPNTLIQSISQTFSKGHWPSAPYVLFLLRFLANRSVPLPAYVLHTIRGTMYTPLQEAKFCAEALSLLPATVQLTFSSVPHSRQLANAPISAKFVHVFRAGGMVQNKISHY